MAALLSFQFACLWLLPILQSVGASQIASFINEHYNAPQVVRYDPETKLIMYSLCNSNSTPVFPANSSAAFDTRPYTPIRGTHVSLTGYVDTESGAIITQLFFQEEEGNIVEEIFACDLSSGLYVPQTGQQYRITDRGLAPRNQADLSALLLGKDGGYQVFYRDENGTVSSLRYKPDERDGWFYSGIVNPIDNMNTSLAAGFAYTDNIHVVSFGHYGGYAPIGLASQRKDKVWDIQTYPIGSKAYNGSYDDDDFLISEPVTSNTNKSSRYYIRDSEAVDTFEFAAILSFDARVAVAFGFKEVLSLFYIGHDKTVYQVAFSGGHWEYPTKKQASIWPPPPADEANADISVAYDYRTNRMWLHYMSNGTLTQVYKPELDEWHAAVALPKFNATADTADNEAGQPAAGGGSGLSSGAKIGIGVGVGLGVPLLLAAIAVYFFFHLRSSRRNRESEAAAVQAAHAAATSQPTYSHPGSPAPRYTSGYWSNGQWVQGPDGPQAFYYGNKPEEVGWSQFDQQGPLHQPTPVFEMPHTNQPQEMMGPEAQSSPVSPSSPQR